MPNDESKERARVELEDAVRRAAEAGMTYVEIMAEVRYALEGSEADDVF